MKCFFHNEQNAVSTCVDCNKALCQECTSNYTPSLCLYCANKRINEEFKKNIKCLVISVIIFIFAYMLANCFKKSDYETFGVSMRMSDFIFQIIMFASIPWGWSVANRITPTFLLICSDVGWIIHLMISFMLSMVIGPFVMVYKIGLSIYNIIKFYKMKNSIKNNYI